MTKGKAEGWFEARREETSSVDKVGQAGVGKRAWLASAAESRIKAQQVRVGKLKLMEVGVCGGGWTIADVVVVSFGLLCLSVCVCVVCGREQQPGRDQTSCRLGDVAV